MNILDGYTYHFIEALSKYKVHYLVVGGYAVNYYGFRRTTGDIDFWIEPLNTTKFKLIDALNSVGITSEVTNEIAKLDFTKPLVFIEGEEPFKIDFMTYVSGVKFEEAWSKKVSEKIDGLKLWFINFDHLILSKINNNRKKYKLEVEELQKISENK